MIAGSVPTVIELDDVSTLGDAGVGRGVFGGKRRWRRGGTGATGSEPRWPIPVPARMVFSGIKALAPDLVWAVGRHQVGYGYKTLIERWDGTSWTDVSSPNVGIDLEHAEGRRRDGPEGRWAVGWYVQEEHYRPLVEHWDGKTWSLVRTPDVGPGDGLLSGVVAIAADDAWAVGWVSHDGSRRPLIERLGRPLRGAWSTRRPTWRTGRSTAVAATSDGFVVVGRLETATQTRPLALQRSGDTWSIVSTPVN